ncbi:MAG: MFS transporter [Solirubrobacterales bacterium]|nr:MFS transporter [Solirubrobacterales bacterium]MCB0859885.1 MFS transporter [Solirubrobacterales bacterium]MCB0862795.1 MFS transporter [Solirubrobacterales bacterium]
MTAALRRSFDSLSVPNFRRYFKGQVVSLSGNWMQTVAEVWLILSLTGSGFAVGIATALQFLPIMLFGAWGGSLADRFAKRDLLMVTQAMMMVPPLILLGVTVAGVVTPAMVFALILIRGSLLSVDNPARQAFVMEMVGPDRIVNAVSLNSVIVHSARVAGPAVAGILIATVGVAPCFGLNAATFLVMIWALRGMDRRRLAEPPKTNSREPGRVRAAVRHVMQTPELAMPLMLMAVVGTLGLNFQVILPLLARLTFEGGASSYAVLVSSMGAGSVIGALVTGARGKTGMGVIAASALAFGGLAMAAALMPSLASEIPVLALLGASAVTFAAAINSTIQLAVEPEMRGRVMALYSVVFLGSTPIGGPLVGFISESADPRLALALASVSGLVAAAGAWWISARNRVEPELETT